MTSTTSSKNKHFGRLFKWAFARNKTIMIVFAVLMAVGIVIDLYGMTKISAFSSDDQLISAYGQIGYFSILIAQTGAILFSLISASHTFSFLHNKRSTDMFGAIPATRSTLFFSHLAGGCTSVAIPFAAGSLAVTAFTCRTVDMLAMDICFILFGIISIAAIYSFSALIAYCCGTKLDTAIIVLGANAIYIGVVTIFWSLATSMIPGSSFEHILNTPVMTLLSPICFGYFLDIYYLGGQTTALWTTLIWSTIYIAGIVFLGSFAAKRRRAETAQSEFNVKWLPTVIKVGISVLGGGFAGMIAAYSFSAGSSGIFVFSFWYILVGFVSFIILHLIFSRGFKGKFLPSLIAYVCTTAVSIGLVLLLTTGMGIDTYIPSASNISRIEFGGYLYSGELYSFSDPENIETITEIHKLITDGIQKEYKRPYRIGSTDIERKYNYSVDYTYSNEIEEKYPLTSNTYFVFTYHKKVGFTTNRSYAVGNFNSEYYDFDKLEELLKKLYSSDEYKKAVTPVLWNEEGVKRNGKLPKSVKLTRYNAEMIYGYNDENPVYTYTPDDFAHNLSTDEGFLNGLFDAMRKDVLADKNYDRYLLFGSDYILNGSNIPGKPYGDGYLGIEIVYPDSINDFVRSPYVLSDSKTINLTIPEKYTNTISYLEANGYSVR